MEINKPITLVREDFMKGVLVLIRQSGLPLFVVEDSLRQLSNGVSELAKQQLEEDRQKYAQAMMTAQEISEKETKEIV